MLIVDDLMKASDAHSPVERERVKAYYQDSLVSRLNDKRTGRIIVIQQRLHEDDLAGFLIASGNFEHLNLMAIAERDESFDLPGGDATGEVGEMHFMRTEPGETDRGAQLPELRALLLRDADSLGKGALGSGGIVTGAQQLPPDPMQLGLGPPLLSLGYQPLSLGEML
jgi:hypothetical protein